MAKVRAGRFAHARDQLERARLTTDDRDLLARIDLSLAYVDAETGDVDAGVARCQALGVRPVALARRPGAWSGRSSR